MSATDTLEKAQRLIDGYKAANFDPKWDIEKAGQIPVLQYQYGESARASSNRKNFSPAR